MINIYSQSGQVTYGIKYYIVDTETEKENLPKSDKIGSKCYVIESKAWYILNGKGEYVPFAAEGGSVDADAILSVIDGMSDSEKSQLRSKLGVASVFTFKGIVEEESDLPSIANSAGDVYLVNETSSEYVWIVISNFDGIEFGRWEKLGSNVSGEPELFFVTFSNQENIWSANKNITEINAAYNAGKTIVFKYGEYLQFAGKGYEGGSNYYKANIIIDKSTYSFAVADFVDVFVSIRDNITPSDIISVTNDMTDEQKSQTRDNLDISNSGLSDDVKQALLNCFKNVAWDSKANGDALIAALEESFAPPRNFVSISAVFDSGDTLIKTSDDLDSLRQYLTVTGMFSDGTTDEITAYSLFGELNEGLNVITVSYADFTTTFTVQAVAFFFVAQSPDVVGGVTSAYYPYYSSNVSRATYVGLDFHTSSQYRYRIIQARYKDSNVELKVVARPLDAANAANAAAGETVRFGDSGWLNVGQTFTGYDDGIMWLTFARVDGKNISASQVYVEIIGEVIS